MYNISSTFKTYKSIIDEYNVEEETDDDSDNCGGIKNEYLEGCTSKFSNNICSKAIYYLNKLEQSRKPQYISYGCKYFSYWLYKDVMNMEISSTDLIKLYKNILNGYKDNSSSDTLLNYLDLINKDIIENLKKLIENYEHFYNFINGNISPGMDKCTYGSACVHLYNENVKICKEKYDYDFCKELEKFRTIYNIYMETSYECNDMQKHLPSFMKSDVPVILIPFFSVLSISALFFIFYKYTPYGSWFRRLVKKEKNILNNLNEENKELQNYSNSQEKHFRSGNHQIAYHSVKYP
ncbi:PIR protein [Plasmodium vivax]|uniref:VIR protein n=1 Tax=Plasmodium vivax TaxID=5855 RepID=A0A565A5Q2_PLAVI|nr:PIR protein [Plasmodium vivax]